MNTNFDPHVYSKAWDKWSRYVANGGNVPKPGAEPSFLRDVVLKSLGDYGRVTRDAFEGAGGGVGGFVGHFAGNEELGRSIGGSIADTAGYFIPWFGASRLVGDAAEAFGAGNTGTGVGSLVGTGIYMLPGVGKVLKTVRAGSKIAPAAKATGRAEKIWSAVKGTSSELGRGAAAVGAGVVGSAYDDVVAQEAAEAASQQGAGSQSEGGNPPDWLVKTLAYGLPAAGIAGSAGLLVNAVSRARRRKSWLLRALAGAAGLAGSAYMLHNVYRARHGGLPTQAQTP